MDFPIKQIDDFFNSIDTFEGITSLWGDFGVGKTTLSLQTAYINALSGSKVIYIYSKPNFPYNKIDSVIEKNLDEVLDNILFSKAITFEVLLNLVFNLEFIIIDDLKNGDRTFNLVVIDSITDLYGLELQQDKKGKNFILNYKLNQMLANLTFLNKKYHVDVLIVNELSRKTQEGQTYEVERGGKVMEYWVKNSIKIERTDKLNHRKFFLMKGKSNNSLVFYTRLNKQGFEEDLK
jgi:RecA/RadA recombinase